MANHQSVLRRIRSSESTRLRNRYQLKTCRTFIKKLRGITDRQEAASLLRRVSSMLDKLAARRIIHKNKAANSKSSCARLVETLQ